MDESIQKALAKPAMTDEAIESLLQDEIRWAVEHGHGWNPGRGAKWKGGQWSGFSIDPAECGLCAIGALVCHQQREPTSDEYGGGGDGDDVRNAAKILGRPIYWVAALYLAVCDGPLIYEEDALEVIPAIRMGWRLRDYGDEIEKRLHKSAT